jgi:hypothetical protein
MIADLQQHIIYQKVGGVSGSWHSPSWLHASHSALEKSFTLRAHSFLIAENSSVALAIKYVGM